MSNEFSRKARYVPYYTLDDSEKPVRLDIPSGVTVNIAKDLNVTGKAMIETLKINSLESATEIKAPSFYATSDKRLKENIKPLEYDTSILNLPIYTFDFISGLKNQIGCLAQDLYALYPDLVKEDDKGFLTIQENKLVYLLIEEVKKLKAEVEELKKGK